MPTIKHKPTREQEAKRLTRLVARSKANWPAEPSLRHLTPMQIEVLQEYIAVRELQQQVLGGVVLIVALLFSAFLFEDMVRVFAQTVCAIFFIQITILHRLVKQHQYAVYALTQTDDLRVLPTLIQATKHSWERQPQVMNAILRLLSQVTEEQVGLFNNATQEQLWLVATRHHSLYTFNDYQLARLAVRALAAVGNRAMLTRMEQFVARSKRLNISQEVRSAVQDVIPIMEARLRRQEVPDTLLRAANVPNAAPDTLLRPTLPATPEPTQQLLRASHSETDNTTL